jgi:hypothetical protein
MCIAIGVYLKKRARVNSCKTFTSETVPKLQFLEQAQQLNITKKYAITRHGTGNIWEIEGQPFVIGDDDDG